MSLHRVMAIGGAMAILLFGGAYARRDFHGFSLVYRAANRQGPIRRVADLDTVPVVDRIIEIPGHGSTMRARVYLPTGRPHQTVLLVSGVHPTGIDEPRLIDLARKLAEARVTVVTPDIPELSRFELTPAVTDHIETAAAWLASSELAPSGRIGLMGISFSGGLAVVAAGRPALREVGNRIRQTTLWCRVCVCPKRLHGWQSSERLLERRCYY